MAEPNKPASKPKPEPKKRSARTTALAGLLAVIAAIAIWLSDCIPGFGIGSGVKDGDGEAEPTVDAEPAKPAEPEPPEPAEPEPPEPAVRKPMPVKLTIDARGCMIDGGEPIDCATLCEDAKRFEGRDAVIIDTKDASHATATEVIDCLKTHDLSLSITRE